jgi:PAS domain S-box-containing protein
MQKNALNSSLQKSQSTVPALKIAAVYLLIGVLWILLSDSILYGITGDTLLLKQLQLYKGWFFITVTAILFFLLIRSQLQRTHTLTGKVNENEQRYKLLFENNPVPMWVFDKDTFQFIEVNDAAIKSYGYSKNEFLNMTVLDIRPEEDKEKAAANIKGIQTSFIPHEPWRHRKKDGAIIRVQISGHDINYLGRNARLILADDITQKWLARQELKDSERRFREVLSNLHLIAVLADTEGNIYFCNDYFLSLTGYSRDEVMGKNYFDIFIPPGNIGKSKAAYTKGISEGRIAPHIEDEIRGKNGRRLHVSWHNTVLKDTEGKVTGIACIGEDITARREIELTVKKAEEALKESEERYRLLVELSTDAIFIRSEGKFVYVNNAGLELFGAESLEQIRDKEITDIIHEDYRKKVYTDSMQLKEEDILPPRSDEKFIRLDGTSVDVEVTRIPFQYNGKFAIQVVARDITQKKQAEVSLLQKTYDLNKRNKELKCLYAVSSLINKPDINVETLLTEIVNLIPCAMQYPEIACSRIIFRGREYSSPKFSSTPWCCSANIDIAERSEGFVEVCYSENRDYKQGQAFVEEEKALINVIATHVKETIERRSAIERIKQLNTELEERVAERTLQLETANKELESFSYSVSHDLRAPLRAIDGFSKILIDDHKNSLDDEALRLLNIICANTEKMSQLIDDLLTFSRLSQQQVVKLPIDMKALVNEVIGEMTVLYPERNIRYFVHDIPPANGDPNMIKQVLVNILSNAVKFTSPRELAEINIGFDKRNGSNIYYIKDNGVGFNMKYVDKLFGVFQRLHSNKEFDGTGVGLALCKKIVNRHNGNIWAESKLDEGSTFYFTL